MLSNKKVEPRRLKGFRDYTPEVMAARMAILQKVVAVAQQAAFQPMATPALEYADVLLGQGGGETDKQVYRFRDHGDREVALRFDLTVPFARFVAEHQGQLVFPFKRFQVGDVWRGENTQRGRYREFCQCDLDVIGVDTLMADAEILICFGRVFEQVAAGPVTIRLGNRGILSALIRRSLPELHPGKETDVLIAIDKLAKIGEPSVTELISQIPGASSASARALLYVIASKDSRGDVDWGKVCAFLGDGMDEGVRKNIERFQQLQALVRCPVWANGLVKFHSDLTIARGLGYYTGMVFETQLDELPGIGSVASGGRYDDLAERFMSRKLPGVGGSLGLDRLLAGLEELGRLPSTTGNQVYVIVATDDAQEYAAAIAMELRRAGVVTGINLGDGKVGQQFKQASRLNYRLAVVVGTDEMRAQTFALKDLETTQERKNIALSQLVSEVRQSLPGQ